MRIELDHVAVAGGTLAEATLYVEKSLGVAPQPGGAHGVFATHNTLLGLQAGLYLEAIAIDPAAVPEQQPRWFDLDRFKGVARLTNWICRCDDLDATLAALPDAFGTPVSLTRGDLRWRMAVPKTGLLPFDNCAPALMQWDGAAHPSARLAASTLVMSRLTVTHPQAAELEALLEPHLSDARVRFEEGSAGLEAQFEDGQDTRILR